MVNDKPMLFDSHQEILDEYVYNFILNEDEALEGKRHIKINAETTILTVTGIARQEDVSDENTIPRRRKVRLGET